MMEGRDYHTHSTMCDGKNTLEEMVLSALEKKMTVLGFSGHMDPDIHVDFPEYLKEVRRLQAAYRDRIDLLIGLELDGVSETLSFEGTEYIIGSTHFLQNSKGGLTPVDWSAELLADLCKDAYGGDPYRMVKAYYETESKIVEKTHCTFIGHFDLITRFNDQQPFFDETDPRYMRPALECMASLVKTGTPFEVNCGAINRGRKKDPYPNHLLLRHLHDMGGEIFLNSDAHDRDHLMAGFPQVLELIRAAGFDHILYLKHDALGCVVLEEQGI
ncbi:MAG: histidinol-phosphatase [Clostridia bacterium]|nr:histidinol-phosphatase [Clostridia bacterium]